LCHNYDFYVIVFTFFNEMKIDKVIKLTNTRQKVEIDKIDILS